jgi:hypothetical protein
VLCRVGVLSRLGRPFRQDRANRSKKAKVIFRQLVSVRCRRWLLLA